jgi:hypothetical protein
MVDLFSGVTSGGFGGGRAALCLGLILLMAPPTLRAQTQNTFTVDVSGEGHDQEPGDGVCRTAQGDCTLRAAVQEANATTNETADVIEFDISGSPPHVIRPDSSLPAIVDPVVLDGTSEPDYDGTPVVELNGENAGPADGLRVDAEGGVRAHGLAVVNFDTAFLLVDDIDGNVIQGCYVGVRTDGETAAGNDRGIFVGTTALNTTIGGGQTNTGNIISGNTTRGVDLTGSVTVLGNRIGVDANGGPMGNGGAGVSTNADGATIGGTEAGQGNVIAHNGGDGVEVIALTPPNVQNTVRGNRFFANEGLGIDLEGGTEDTDGRTQNDVGDGDDGQNRLQNFPESERSSYAPATGEVTVAYRVPSDPTVDASGASGYPLSIDFYLADADDEEGRVYLGTDAYTSANPNDYSGCGSPPCTVTTTFIPQSPVDRGNDVVAVATDSGGNTSEFSSVTVLSLPPEATTNSATGVTSLGATFHGQVNPDGAETEVVFEYSPVGDTTQVWTVQADQSPLTGTQVQSVSTQVSRLQPNTAYEVRVVATSDAGTTQGETVEFSTSSLDLTVEHAPQVPDAGTSVEIEVTVPESFSPFEAQLFYRRGGTQEYQLRPLEQIGDLTFEAAVPGAAVTGRGVEYYVRLESEIAVATVPADTPAERPLFIPARISSVEAEVTLATERYHMVSVPAQVEASRVGAIFEDDFGSEARRDWRLLRWVPDGQQTGCGAGRYEDLTLRSGPEASSPAPGRAYWLISRSGGTFDVEEAHSAEAVPFTLTLPPGWSQIANPHPYPVAWADVEQEGTLQNGSPFAFEAEEGAGTYVPNVSILGPWEGYWVCNPGADSVDITIPRKEAAQSAQSERGTARARSSIDSLEALFERDLTYALTLSVSLDRGKGARTRDVDVVAVGPDATSELGPEDIVEPPSIQDGLRLSIVEDSTQLLGSLRPDADEGHAWDLELPAPPDTASSKTAWVQLETYGSLPADLEHRLVDRETGRQIPIRDGRFSVSLADDRAPRRLRLLVGPPAYTEKAAEAVRPDRTALRAVYPNPATGPVSIDYQLRMAQHVQVEVYDILGRRVKTLINERQTAGSHTLRWKGGDRQKLASGMYIVRLKAGSTTAGKRLSIVR